MLHRVPQKSWNLCCQRLKKFSFRCHAAAENKMLHFRHVWTFMFIGCFDGGDWTSNWALLRQQEDIEVMIKSLGWVTLNISGIHLLRQIQPASEVYLLIHSVIMPFTFLYRNALSLYHSASLSLQNKKLRLFEVIFYPKSNACCLGMCLPSAN